MSEILDLTYPQLKNIFDGVVKKVLFEIKISTLPVGGSVDECDLPFYSEKIEENRVFTINDAMKLSNMANK